MEQNKAMPANAGAVITRLRMQLRLKQNEIAAAAGVDQSRVSRAEKGEFTNESDVAKIINALAELGSKDAVRYKEFLGREWRHMDVPAFWNPEAPYLETAEETLEQIEGFLAETDTPWPLRRQVERHRNLLEDASSYLQSTSHQIAFIGDIGVGKSTALSFLYELLIPPGVSDKLTDRVLLEAGAGGTTICEVHVRRGPEYGIAIQPMPGSELRQLVADFCTAKWLQLNGDGSNAKEAVGVGREIERAIRNMSGLTTRRERGRDGKPVRHDHMLELVKACTSEDELRTKVLDAMQLRNRSQREIWFDADSGKASMTWMAQTFKAVNNGRMHNMSLPRTIDLLIPEFGAEQGELEVAVIDSKGVDDLAVREDLDARLRDPRTAIVLCTRFNDAPSQTVRILLEHMRSTFGERVDTGKLSILALPRTGEAMAMKDDAGEPPMDDADGYDLKREQIERTLGGADQDLAGAPIHFLNVETDNAKEIRADIFKQIGRMRGACADRVLNLCASIDDLIKNHETQAVSAAVEEVAAQLRMFLESNREMKAREKHAYDEALKTVASVRYASTLWASARRNGQYSGLSIGHQTGNGAAQDGILRSNEWFSGMKMHLNALKANPDFALALRTIEQVEVSIDSSKGAFAEALQTAGIEVYREPLQQANELWSSCAGEWGRGPGFTRRVQQHLKEWFEKRSDLKDKLEDITLTLWEQKVIRPIVRLVDENANESDQIEVSNVVHLSRHATENVS